MVAAKRQYNHKIFCEKCQALKDLEKERSNKNVAAKYALPKNTLSIWLNNKEKPLESPEKGSSIKRQKSRTGNFEMVDKAILKWFLSMGTQNVSLSAAMIQKKVLTVPK